MRGGDKTGPNPTDRAKAGTKRHLITDGDGAIIAASVTSSNRHDSTQAKPLLENRPRVRQRHSRKQRNPRVMLGDHGYDSEDYRQWLRGRDIMPAIARRAKPGQSPEHGSGLGVFRWVVENAHALLNKFRYIICDTCATHKHPKVRIWLARNKRFHVHFTATSASRLNTVERFFCDL